MEVLSDLWVVFLQDLAVVLEGFFSELDLQFFIGVERMLEAEVNC